MKSIRFGKKLNFLVFMMIFIMEIIALTVPVAAFAKAQSKNTDNPKAAISILIQPGETGRKINEKNYYSNPSSKEYQKMEVKKKFKKNKSVYLREEGTSLITAAVPTQNQDMVMALEGEAPKILVLYDAPSGQAYSKLGKIYGVMMLNLLGHFEADVDLLAIHEYTQGTVDLYDAIFYLGSYYGNPIPDAFLSDAFNTTRTVVWFKYNIWQLAWNGSYDFNGKFGFSFLGLRGLNGVPSVQNPNPGFFDTIQYKNKSMVKYYNFIPETGVVMADPDVGVTQINNAALAELIVPVDNPVTSERVPYVVKSGNFWYFADLPLSFIGPRDRYLVLCDMLHDILGTNHEESHRAMVRLEDVGFLTYPENMETLSDYFQTQNIPFSIALIPHYLDPNGAYNDGVPMDVALAESAELLFSLQYAVARGGSILMHGFTHQYSNIPNQYTAVSGDDFEFWLTTANTPVTEDSVEWAQQRIQSGIDEMFFVGITPFAFEFPHYQGSPKSYQAAGNLFPTRYERSFYYTSDTPQLNLAAEDPNRDFAAGQFFPYVILKDYYGKRVLPENLGNIEYDISHIDPTSNVVYTWQDLATNADFALTVRDGFASFFFHPFWLEGDLGTPGFADLQSLVQAITALGYTWTGANSL
ncbi:MAG: DUF2334 domain-containing protein [Candidatus Omnitrophota bacterium]